MRVPPCFSGGGSAHFRALPFHFQKGGCAVKYLAFFPSFLEVFDSLDIEEARDLLKGMVDYSTNGGHADFKTKCAKIAFLSMKHTIDSSIEKYERKCAANAENGKKGGRPKKPKQPNETQNNPVGFFGSKQNPKNPRSKVNDNKQDSLLSSPSSPPQMPPPPMVKIPSFNEVHDFLKSQGKDFDCSLMDRYGLLAATGWLDSDGSPIRDWRRYFSRIAENEAKERRKSRRTGTVLHQSGYKPSGKTPAEEL